MIITAQSTDDAKSSHWFLFLMARRKGAEMQLVVQLFTISCKQNLNNELTHTRLRKH